MMAEVDIASHDLMTKETSRTEPKQESTSHTLSVPAPMRIKASSVNLRENSELIQYYLRFLRLRNEEFIRNYKPTDWELLSQEERLQIAITRIHREEDNTFAAKLLINETIRDYKEYKKQQRLIRMNPSTNASASNNLSTTVHTTTNTAAIDLIGNPEDTSVDELEDLLNC
ncbi:hypothetical protein PGTUg99_026682 [Puccinia graminis f. sp. tritici]|uniref:Uncharacterized protein n=1 Tax=Puccinia graminis f. sp. tritici TaxID=56615 RepID=A0A5B0PJJ8_PUCGR|nr:hypothetical protein PGTUg99_026682 [Puccinia graminis f. sp. tritici]